MTGRLPATKSFAYQSAKVITITSMQLSKSFINPRVWVWKGIYFASDAVNLAIAEPQMVDSQRAQSVLKELDQVEFPLSANFFGRLTARLAQSSRSPFLS